MLWLLPRQMIFFRDGSFGADQSASRSRRTRSAKRISERNGELNEELLLGSWRSLRKDAALGVDRVSAAEYEANLGENIKQMVERLKRKLA
jgi:hypothetical protein